MNLFKLVATIGLDSSEYESNVKKAAAQGQHLAHSLGHGLVAGAKLAAKSLAAVSTAIGGLTVAAVKQYAEYEQLVGGVDTLFKDSSKKVQGYADVAYQTAGMSANAYMETVTGFSASLLQSLGGDTEAAADLANQAIIDMSDNANKMGTDISAIQFAYSGFAKQNYTMLDNLKLGYGGTKKEMERLIKDANRLRREQGKNADLTIESYADIIEAIHTVQEEIGITGTTREEAAKTIEGSISSMKAAFHNLVTGFGNENANLGQLTENFLNSAITVAKNVIPRISQVLEGIKEVGVKTAPKIAEGISEAVKAAPQFLKAGMDVLHALGSALIKQAPTLMDSAFYLLGTILDGLNSDPGAIFEGMLTLLKTFAEKLDENGQTLYDKAVTLTDGLIDAFVKYAPEMVVASIELIAKLAAGLLDHLPENLDKAYAAVDQIVAAFTSPENLSKMASAGRELGQALINALPDIADLLTFGTTGLHIPGSIGGGGHDQFLDDAIAGRNPWATDNTPATPSPSRPPRVPPRRPGGPSYRKYASGLDYVPFDGFLASLHKGERILTREEANAYTGGGVNLGGVTINISGAQYQDPMSLAEAISEELQKLTTRREAVYA